MPSASITVCINGSVSKRILGLQILTYKSVAINAELEVGITRDGDETESITLVGENCYDG